MGLRLKANRGSSFWAHKLKGRDRCPGPAPPGDFPEGEKKDFSPPVLLLACHKDGPLGYSELGENGLNDERWFWNRDEDGYGEERENG